MVTFREGAFTNIFPNWHREIKWRHTMVPFIRLYSILTRGSTPVIRNQHYQHPTYVEMQDLISVVEWTKALSSYNNVYVDYIVAFFVTACFTKPSGSCTYQFASFDCAGFGQIKSSPQDHVVTDVDSFGGVSFTKQRLCESINTSFYF